MWCQQGGGCWKSKVPKELVSNEQIWNMRKYLELENLKTVSVDWNKNSAQRMGN